MRDVLFLAHRSPWPPDRGDRIRSWHVLKHLARRAQVHLVAFADDASPPPPAELLASCTIVPRRKSRARATLEALASGRPISLTAFDDPAMHAAVAAAPRADAIYCFSGQMAQYLPTGGPPVVMDFVDVDSAKFAQLARTAAPPLRPLLRREARLLGAWEREVSSRVAASLFVTDAEATLFRAGGGGGRIAVVENGIDARLYDPAAAAAAPVPAAGPLIVFTGQMDYRPNVEAVAWFARAVLPLVRERHRDARFAIVGRAPTAEVRALARAPGVLVTGEVADVRGWLAAASVCVAPLRLARGVQNKVLEAMAMARPVVASRAAAEGIDHGGALTVANGAGSWVEAVAALLADPAAGDALGRAARARVVARYDWEARLAPLDALLSLEAIERVAA